MYFGRPSEEAREMMERNCIGHGVDQHPEKGEETAEQNGSWQTTILQVKGMTCAGCKLSVEKALARVPGVINASVDLLRKEAVVKGTATRDTLVKAVEGAGYSVI